jgi:hypothetical protein
MSWICRTLWYGVTEHEAFAWASQRRAGYSFGYDDFRDAQNNAVRGDMDAIYAVHVFKIYLLTEHLR